MKRYVVLVAALLVFFGAIVICGILAFRLSFSPVVARESETVRTIRMKGLRLARIQQQIAGDCHLMFGEDDGTWISRCEYFDAGSVTIFYDQAGRMKSLMWQNHEATRAIIDIGCDGIPDRSVLMGKKQGDRYHNERYLTVDSSAFRTVRADGTIDGIIDLMQPVGASFQVIAFKNDTTIVHEATRVAEGLVHETQITLYYGLIKLLRTKGITIE